jgi:hypothetical protein
VRLFARNLGRRHRLGELRLSLRVDGAQVGVLVVLLERGLCIRERRLGVVDGYRLQESRRPVLGAGDLGAGGREHTGRARLMRAPPGRGDQERKDDSSADSVAHATSASQTTCQSHFG